MAWLTRAWGCKATKVSSPKAAPSSSKLVATRSFPAAFCRSSWGRPARLARGVCPTRTASHFARFKRSPSSAPRLRKCSTAGATLGTVPPRTPSSRKKTPRSSGPWRSSRARGWSPAENSKGPSGSPGCFAKSQPCCNDDCC